MIKVYVSACLLGQNVKYDGSNNYLLQIEELKKYAKLIPFCPEVAGKLPTPRTPSEIKGPMVISSDNKDRTMNFFLGATLAEELIINENIKYVLSKEKSPSCGVKKIYDGTFSHTLIDGEGITTRLLREHQVKIFSEEEIELLLEELKAQVKA